MNVTIADLNTITEDVMSTMAGLVTVSGEAPIGVAPHDRWLEGRIEIQGRWRGELTIACGPVLAATLASAFFGEPVTVDRVDDVHSALLELANIFAGHLNALMEAPSRITLPRMVELVASGVCVDHGGPPELVAAYSCSGQELLVTLRDTTHCNSDRA